jgi:hypothetical protein
LGLSSPLVLGFVGYVREWHGLEHVVDLVAKDPALADAHLLIVGDGPARVALEARARAAGAVVSVPVREMGHGWREVCVRDPDGYEWSCGVLIGAAAETRGPA